MIKTKAEVFQNIDSVLENAKSGLDMVVGRNPKYRRIGLQNLIVFGRAVTNVLQNLKSIEPRFDEWYSPWVQIMKKNEVACYFYKMRSEILKEGVLNTSTSISIERLDIQSLMRVIPKPKNATAFFIGDHLGGSGWEIDVGGGKSEKLYIEIPDGIPGVSISAELHLPNAPEGLKTMPISMLAKDYFELIQSMVNDAKSKLM